ncbi:MAG: hypothetical protein IPJ19_21090 [Planctomycetes bacterium]|nr:hypothetical protein [Planctomycetota bacterium]
MLLLLCSACVGTRKLADPVLEIRTPKGSELGVATDHGLIFLGHTANSGRAEITAWFGDGPSVEPIVIEPVGGGLYTAETEIRLPSVPISFVDPRPGDQLTIIGRDEDGTWSTSVRVANEPRALGILTDIPRRLRGHDDQTGAGVFVPDPIEPSGLRLVGLVAGIVNFQSAKGTREYLAIVGPQDLWRLVTHRHDETKKRRWIYRDDIL